MPAKNKKLLIILLGLVVFALSYFLGYNPLVEKRNSLNAENVSLRETFDDLSMKKSNAEMYTKEIKVMNTKMEDIYTHYPSFLQTENEIIDAVTLEDVTESYISSLTISEPMAVSVTGEEQDSQEETGEEPVEVSAEETASVELPYQLYDVNSTISFESGYAGLKQIIQLIASDSKKKSVGTLSAVFDNTTGKISGNMSYDTYFVYGLDKPYVEPEVPSIKHGTKNIFGTVEETKKEQKKQKTEN